MDHASAHALGFVTTNVSPGLDDEDFDFLLAQGLLVAKERSLSPGHTELASRALRELWPDGIPRFRVATRYGGGQSHHLGSEVVRGSELSASLDASRPTADIKFSLTRRHE